MKSIKKITSKVSDNVSALAGSALLVGATLTGGAAFAAASSHTGGSSGNSMDLGDYPHPFVDEDGQVDTSIVLGSDAQVTDVVGATEIAGSLGAAAFGEESVSTSGGSFGWNADNGVTLDTRNDQLYFGDSLDTVRETLTEDDLDILAETTFTDDNNDETDITNYLNVGSQQVVFGNGADELDNEDPQLHVEVPAESDVDQDSYLFNLQANFEDSIDFTSSDVAGEEIELFGTDYTIAQDNENGPTDELLLYGSQQEVDVSTGESTTITVNGEEVTIETVSVNEGSTSSGQSGNAAVRVDGTLESVESGDSISVNNEEVRIDEIIKTGGSDSSNGVVNFQVGSQELTLINGGPIQDSNDDDIEGSYVEFDGGDTSDISDVSNIDLYVGAENDDEDALTSGDTFSHSALPGVEVHFGGLNPDAAEEGDTVSEVEFSTSGDDTSVLDFTAQGGDDASINYAYSDDTADNSGQPSNRVNLADSDDDAIQTKEGVSVYEDQYFLADAGDFSHMFEVTGIDRDTHDDDGSSYSESDEATIDLRDTVTGETIEVDLDVEDHGSYEDEDTDYAGTEVIDGQKYYFELDGSNEDNSGDGLQVTWGEGITSNDDSGVNQDIYTVGDKTTISPALDTESDAAVTFMKDVRTSASTLDSTTVDDFTSGGAVSQSLSVDGSGNDATITLDLSDISGTDTQDVYFDVSNGTDTDTFQMDDDDDSGSVTKSTSNIGDLTASRTGEDEVQLNLANGSSSDIQSIAITQAGEPGTVTATDADGDDFTVSAFNDIEVSYTEGATVDLSTYEFPSTESTDAIYGQSSQAVTFQSAGDSDATFSIGGLTYEIDTDGDLRPANLNSNGNNPNYVASALILPEDDNDNEQAYVFEHGYDDSDEELTSKNLAQAPQTALDSQTSLESDDDISAGYDFFGAYHEVDSDEQGSVTLQVPEGQAVAGAAVTETDGALSMGGGSGSATAASPSYSYADGLLTDDENVGQARDNENLVLVGGPAANSLTQDLVDQNQTMPAGNYTSGQGMVQMVDGWNEGTSALVVAGATGEDTRAAAEFLADYRNNQDSLEGQSQVTIETSSGSVVE